MTSYLAISTLGSNQNGLLKGITQAIIDCNCNIVESRMNVLGSAFGSVMLVEGNWNTLTKLESQLQKTADQHGASISWRRTESVEEKEPALPYGVEVISLDQPGIVHHLNQFFSSRDVLIEELVSRTYNAHRSNTPLSMINLTILVPAKLPIAMLREEFLDFCDELNLDAVIEPVKG